MDKNPPIDLKKVAAEISDEELGKLLLYGYLQSLAKLTGEEMNTTFYVAAKEALLAQDYWLGPPEHEGVYTAMRVAAVGEFEYAGALFRTWIEKNMGDEGPQTMH